MPIGERRGMLQIIGPKVGRNIPVRCDCGKEKMVNDSNFRDGRTKSCGCNMGCKPRPAERYGINLGDVFGSLTVVDMSNPSALVCKCICEKQRTLHPYHLAGGEYKSCGCKAKRYVVGDIINGRKVIESGTKKSLPKVQCLGCGKISRVAAWGKAKCRNCAPWDTRMVSGYVYGIVCPLALEIVYVGSTKTAPYRRVRDHFSERNAADNKHRPLYIWMRELARDGHMPGCIQLEHVETGNLHEREVFWIQKMSSDGATLLNHEHNS